MVQKCFVTLPVCCKVSIQEIQALWLECQTTWHSEPNIITDQCVFHNPPHDLVNTQQGMQDMEWMFYTNCSRCQQISFTVCTGCIEWLLTWWVFEHRMWELPLKCMSNNGGWITISWNTIVLWSCLQWCTTWWPKQNNKAGYIHTI